MITRGSSDSVMGEIKCGIFRESNIPFGWLPMNGMEIPQEYIAFREYCTELTEPVRNKIDELLNFFPAGVGLTANWSFLVAPFLRAYAKIYPVMGNIPNDAPLSAPTALLVKLRDILGRYVPNMASVSCLSADLGATDIDFVNGPNPATAPHLKILSELGGAFGENVGFEELTLASSAKGTAYVEGVRLGKRVDLGYLQKFNYDTRGLRFYVNYIIRASV